MNWGALPWIGVFAAILIGFALLSNMVGSWTEKRERRQLEERRAHELYRNKRD